MLAAQCHKPTMTGVPKSHYINMVMTWGWFIHMGLSENVVYPIVPNGFADHYPY